jgi:long-chain acyl-CoA synthetase
LIAKRTFSSSPKANVLTFIWCLLTLDIAPEKLEAIYAKTEVLMQCFVHGDSLQSELIAVIVPDPEKFGAWLKTNLGDIQPLAAVTDAKVQKAIVAEMMRVGRKYNLAGYIQ